MDIRPGISIIGPALWIKKENILIINDLHIGYEESLHHQGVLVPRTQLLEIISLMEKILDKTRSKTIIINGDLKHEFGKILAQEWKEVLQFLDFLSLRVEKTIIIQGNHDPIIKPIAKKRGVLAVKEYRLRDIHIVHGDELPETTAKTIIIGHEHPAIMIREGRKWERYKCFLKGKWKRKTLIVVPSFNPLLEGTDILEGRMLSPFLTDISLFNVYIVSKGEAFGFGKVKDIKERSFER